ncbi:MAG: carboxypeptidase-like regulatory domain-containing protein [Cyclobacteriaceae bacterium]|nr:carboxypeptidase-like regulatory domain-containing protein [Cyclobacteriaceae bacterium]
MRSIVTVLLLIISAFISTVINNSLIAQSRELKGLILDEKTSDPIAFAAIQVIDTFYGSISDVDGRFRIIIPDNTEGLQLAFSCMGYQKREMSLEHVMNNPVIQLQPTTFVLKEVVVEAGENPAHRIIRKAISHKKDNDPLEIESVVFNCYNKTTCSLLGLDEFRPDDIQKDVLKGGHIFMMESYTQVSRKKPGLYKEKILESQITGLDKPEFAMLASTFQPFSFYSDIVTLFDLSYINPIHRNSLQFYNFHLEDSVIHQNDTTFILSFDGKKNHIGKTLKGFISINTDRFAIESIEASPADDDLKIDFRIQQLYQRIEDRWFPVQLYTRYYFKDNTIENRPLVLKNQSYFKNIDLGVPLRRSDFNKPVSVWFERAAEADWEHWRGDTLSYRELKTYENFDTLDLRTKRSLNLVARTGMHITQGRVPFGPVSLIPRHLIRYNAYEKLRLGLGLRSNERISEHVQAGLYGAYGFGDRALKYGAMLHIKPVKNSYSEFVFSYSQDLKEPGSIEYLVPDGMLINPNKNVFREIINMRMDSVQRFAAEYKFAPFRGLSLALFGRREHYRPTYDYHYTASQESIFKDFIHSEAGFILRLSPRERAVQIGPHRVVAENGNPLVQVLYSKALSGIMQGETSFHKLAMQYRQVWRHAGSRQTHLIINTGIIDGDVIPYPFLFNGYGMKTEDLRFSFYAPGYFQTMGLFEFLSDRYLQMSFEHNLGIIFSGFNGAVRPELVVVQNTAYGSLREPERHQGIVFQSMENGLHESGVILKNLLRADSKQYWMGINAGIFHRYGYYSHSRKAMNLQFTFNTQISF